MTKTSWGGGTVPRVRLMPIAKDVILGERVVILEAATESMAERGRLVSLNRAAMT